jgi:hypothetical protein
MSFIVTAENRAFFASESADIHRLRERESADRFGWSVTFDCARARASRSDR